MSHSGQQYYFFRIRGKVEGPFDLARAQALVRRGRLSRFHEVSVDRVHWHRATEFPELFVAQVEQKTRGMLVEAEESSSTAQTPEAAAAEQLWYYSLGNQQLGPVPLSQLGQMIRSGQLDQDALVWTEGMEEWMPWRSVPALRAYQEPVAASSRTATETTLEKTKPPKVSGMALTSLILGSVFWGVLLVFIGALAIPPAAYGFVLLFGPAVGFVVAVVMAHLALSDLRQHQDVAGRGIGITGLILGYAGMTVVIVFFLLMLLVGAALMSNFGRLVD